MYAQLSFATVLRCVSAGSVSFSKNILTETAKRTMTSWESQKTKFLTMPLDNKREHYRMKCFNTLEEVSTWPQYCERKGAALATKTPALADFQLDASKNKEIAKKVSIFKGDITSLEIDAIVNAANNKLLGGGGVDGAIHKAAGSDLKNECKTLNGCPDGEAKVTGGYKLPAKYVIHTVGPRGEKPDVLRKCYKNCLTVMLDNKFRTIAFPCISTGIYGYPLAPAAHIATTEVRKYLEGNMDKIDRVIFCLFSEEDVDIYEGVMQIYFPLV